MSRYACFCSLDKLPIKSVSINPGETQLTVSVAFQAGSSSTVRNIPENKKVIQTPFDFDTHGKKIILYQGSVNVGRGLDLMIDTMHLLEDYILVIIGDGDISTKLIEKVNTLDLKNCVKFLGRINPDELKNLTPNTTVGMSLEEDLGLNYRFALPNKIFDYIQAEVPVLVSDLPEMKKIVSDYKVGEVVFNRTPKTLAQQIEKILKKNCELNKPDDYWH